MFQLYDSTITPFVQQRFWATLESMKDAVLLQSRFRRGEIADVELLEEQRTILQRPFRIAQQIYATNLEYLGRIESVLASDESAALRRMFNATAYPALFPDPYDMSAVIDAIAGEDDLADPIDVRDAQSAVNLFQTTRQGIETEMIRRFMDWNEQFTTTMTMNGERTRAYAQEMQRLQESRRDNALALVDGVLILPSVDRLDELATLLRKTRERLAEPVKQVGLGFGF